MSHETVLPGSSTLCTMPLAPDYGAEAASVWPLLGEPLVHSEPGE